MAFLIRTELLVVLLCVALPASALAAPEAAAKRAAIRARTAFDTGQFDEAIGLYEEAYRLKPSPNLLFNLAQSHRRAGHGDEALSYYRRYLETNPPHAQATATEGLIDELVAEQALARSEKEAREAEARRLELERSRADTARAEEAAAQRKLELEQALRAPAIKTAPPLVTRWWFWTAIGVVAAGTAVGVAVGTAPHPTPTTYPDINAR